MKRGVLENISELKELMEKYPKNKFFVTVRNSNYPKNMTNFGLYIESEIDDTGRAYVNRKDINDFLPKVWQEKDSLNYEEFKIVCSEMANEMNRPVCLIHQFGSGRPEEATFNKYNFLPKKKGK